MHTALQVIDGSTIEAGNVVLALPSSGVHSNGFSLVRKVLEKANASLKDKAPWSDRSFGEVGSQASCFAVSLWHSGHARVPLLYYCHKGTRRPPVLA